MSTLPSFGQAAFDEEAQQPGLQLRRLVPPRYVGVALLLAVLGLSTIWSTVLYFTHLWSSDALKSIGAVIPAVSLFLILRAWRSLGWDAQPSWWGALILLLNALAVYAGEQATILLKLTSSFSMILPPAQLVLVAYAGGAVLLLGGTRLFRAALFPVLLLVLSNPVPHLFSSLVDLPLQQASAHLARGFAVALGQPLTPDRLRLMFTPEFGMFIAPGCNGIRGAVTMGLIALVAGHIYRFRWYMSAAVVAGAILLGYLFNLLRLCLLVLYYLVALHLSALQNKAETADYIIGAALFFVATLLLFEAVSRLRAPRKPPLAVPANPLPLRSPHYAPLAAFALLGATAWIGIAQTHAVSAPPPTALADASLRRFPSQLGTYQLVKTWDETQLAGALIYSWAQYAPQQGGTPISIGLAPAGGWHNPIFCHAARGERPLWLGQVAAEAEQGAAMNFTSAFYDDGTTRSLESSTLCSALACGETTTDNRSLGLIYSRPDAQSLISRTGQPISPVLIRVESADRSQPEEKQRQALTQATQGFLASVNLAELTQPYRR